jgi:hypothetical protein
LLSFVGYLCRAFWGRGFGLGFFSVDTEGNIATWYASILLLLCAVLLAAIAFFQAKACDRYHQYWRRMALIFLYLSIDEAASLHEQMGTVSQVIKTSGLFYFSWVIPALILVSFFIGYYLKFLVQLRPKTKHLFLLSGMIYILGGLGFEMLGGLIAESNGKGLVYTFLSHCEEGLELLGLTIFIYTLLEYFDFKLQNTIIYIKK